MRGEVSQEAEISQEQKLFISGPRDTGWEPGACNSALCNSISLLTYEVVILDIFLTYYDEIQVSGCAVLIDYFLSPWIINDLDNNEKLFSEEGGLIYHECVCVWSYKTYGL